MSDAYDILLCVIFSFHGVQILLPCNVIFLPRFMFGETERGRRERKIGKRERER